MWTAPPSLVTPKSAGEGLVELADLAGGDGDVGGLRRAAVLGVEGERGVDGGRCRR